MMPMSRTSILLMHTLEVSKTNLERTLLCVCVSSLTAALDFDIRKLCKNPTLTGENPVTGADTKLSAGCAS